MRKILSFTLVLVLLLSAVCPVFAYEKPKPPYDWNFVEDEAVIVSVRESFKNYNIAKQPYLSSKDEAFFESEMYVAVFCTQDEAAVFYGNLGEVLPMESNQLIGRYVFFNGNIAGEEYKNPIGLYAMLNNGTTVNLIDAYEEGLIDIDDVAAHIPNSAKLSDREYAVVEYLGLGNTSPFGCSYCYNELYLLTTEEVGATPAIVLIEAAELKQYAGTYTEVIGDYVVASRVNFEGDKLPYYVYTGDKRILTLKEAYEENNPFLEDALMCSELPCSLKGDADSDYALTIKDATYIQKKLASLSVEKAYNNQYIESAVEDFDEDGILTIKDATSIQKRLAGLEY